MCVEWKFAVIPKEMQKQFRNWFITFLLNYIISVKRKVPLVVNILSNTGLELFYGRQNISCLQKEDGHQDNSVRVEVTSWSTVHNAMFDGEIFDGTAKI